MTGASSAGDRLPRILFVESGRRGGSVFRLRSILDHLDRERFQAGFLSWYHGGAATSLFELSWPFCRASLRLRGEQPDALKHPFGVSLPTPFAFRYFVTSLLLLRRHRPDLVYLNTGLGDHQPILWAAGRLGIPVVCHVRHSRDLTRDERRVAWRVQRFVVSTRWGAAHYQGQLGHPPAALDCVSDAIDLVTFDRRTREQPPPNPLAEDTIHVCQVGSLIPRKRPRLAVEAFALARGQCPSLRLVLAGDGPLRGEIDALVREKGLESSVERLGHVTNVPALLKRCHVGLLVSEHEGMPNAVMEYMAAGLPVVVGPLGGIEEMVEHGRSGVVVGQASVEALAEALVHLALDRERRAAYGRAGRDRIETGPFTPEGEARGVEGVVERTLAATCHRGQP